MNGILYTLIIILGLGNIFQYYKSKKRKSEYSILNREKNLYRNILDSIPIAIFSHSRLRFIFANKAGGLVFELDDPSVLIGKHISEMIQVNMEVIGEERIKNASEGKPFEVVVEEHLISKTGEIIAVDLISMPMELEGKTAVLNVSSVLDQRKELENLKRKVDEEKQRLEEVIEYDKLKTEFFSNLSHELRTPLTLILGVITLLEKSLKESKVEDKEINVEKKMKILKQNCYRLLRLVNNLIDMTKLDAGYFELELEECNIVNVVEDITMSCVEYIENRGIQVEFDTDVEEKIIACDPEKVERIVLNILSNAIKFTPTGGKITVYLMDKGDEISISIKDTGIGMPEEKINTIFERFIQIDKSFTRSHEGSGIGLSLVKSLVEMHEGHIKVESEYGNGTEFTINFPAKLLDKPNELIRDSKNENYVERIHIEFSDIYN